MGCRDAPLVICVLLALCNLGSTQVDLKTCGDENSAVTCAFFFNKVDGAFRQRNVLYTLRKAFFPTEGAPPFLFDIEMTLEIESVPNVMCKSDDYAFGDFPISSPPSKSEVCDLLYDCDPLVLRWTHQWSKTIVSYIIEREDLELLQDTNFVAFAAATFNSIDTSVFSDDGGGLEDNSTNSTSLGVAGVEAVQFYLTIDHLPCRPDDNVLLEAWEDILPWVGERSHALLLHVRVHCRKLSVCSRTIGAFVVLALWMRTKIVIFWSWVGGHSKQCFKATCAYQSALS